jgi:hypothetical protein
MRTMARGITGPLRRWVAWLGGALLLLLGAVGIALAFRQGLVPTLLNPLPTIDLAEPAPWLVDWRLAAIKRHPNVCARTLKAPQIEARPIPDVLVKEDCGWSNAVRLTSAGGARAPFDKLTCEMAVALALWLQHEVQPLAMELFGQRVTLVRSYGSYACRNVSGNRLMSRLRSQHAYANAADIRSFMLADGRAIDVRRHWSSDGPEGRFLRQAHARACAYFRVAVGPNYNAAHDDHFHFDRGPFSRCK